MGGYSRPYGRRGYYDEPPQRRYDAYASPRYGGPAYYDERPRYERPPPPRDGTTPTTTPIMMITTWPRGGRRRGPLPSRVEGVLSLHRSRGSRPGSAIGMTRRRARP